MSEKMRKLPRILLVEDDKHIAGALLYTLQSSYDMEHVTGGKVAIFKTETNEYDLILLDLNLPDMDALAICQKLRSRGISVPIFILGEDNKVSTKVMLLDAGANDYLTKPFTLGELKARIRVLLRSQIYRQSWPQPVIKSGNVKLDRNTCIVERSGHEIILRKKEFDILACLMENAGKVISRKELIAGAWESLDVWTNTLEVHIKHLRDKLDKPFQDKLIRTVHGRGYMFSMNAESEST